MSELVTRRWPWARARSVRLEADRLVWTVGRRTGALALGEIVEVRVHSAPPGASPGSVCRIRTRTGPSLTLSDLYALGWGRFERRTEAFEALAGALLDRLAAGYPQARRLIGPSRTVWLASLVMLVALVGVVLAGAALMIAEGRIAWAGLAFMGLALAQLPLLWPIVRSGGPKPHRSAQAETRPTLETIMPNLVLTYTLKPDVRKDDFEAWVRETDYPAMRGLKRISSFVTYRTEKLLVGEGKPPVDYVELFAIADLDGFIAEDMPGQTVQRIMGEFFTYVDNPAFMIVSDVK